MNPSLLLGLALAVGAPAVKDPPKKDAPSIAGEWVAVSVEAGGKGQDFPDREFAFTLTADGKFLIRRAKGGETAEGVYKLDPKKSPPEIDVSYPQDQGETPLLGIYKLDGDALTLCLAEGKDARRPTKFESPAGARVMVLVLERVKKKD